MKIPKGWPTDEMLTAGYEAYLSATKHPRLAMGDAFKAMLAAASTRIIIDDGSCPWEEGQDGDCLLLDAPTPPEQEGKSAGWPTKTMIEAAWTVLYSREENRGKEPWELLREALVAALAAATTPPAQEYGCDGSCIDGPVCECPNPEEYNAPPSDGLRKAAEGVIDSVHEGNLYSVPLTKRFWHALDSLRAELDKGK